MVRVALLLSLVVVLLLESAVHRSRSGVEAQEATPPALMAMATHPITGTWTLVNKTADSRLYPSVAVFHPDGTYLEVLPWGSPLLGVWQPTGERTAVVTQVVNALLDNQVIQGQGRATLAVDASGQKLTWHGVFVNRSGDGQLATVDEVVALGTRLEAGPMLSLEELEATPVPSLAATPVP